MTGPENRLVTAVAYNGLCTFEFGVAVELFGLPRPELDVAWYHFSVASPDPSPIGTLAGIQLSVPTDLELVATAGTVVLPGWRDPAEAPPQELIIAIRTAHERGARILSICSGVFVLAATGLLDGHAATTHWRYTDQLTSMHPRIDVQPDVLYVDNGTTLTSAGSAAGLDLGLHLIRRDFGAAVANRVARRLVIAPHRAGGQAQFITDPIPAASLHQTAPASIAATVAWIMEHLDQPITVEDLAERSNMSARTFARRFRDDMGVPPHQWLTRQRVVRAQQLLETTDLPIERVAAACGFGSGATLRHHFHRETRTSPRDYRRTFTEVR